MSRSRPLRIAAVVLLGLAASGCSTWSSASVKPPPGGPTAAAPAASARPVLDPAQVMLTAGDVDRPYDVLGDIAVTVNKTTVFHPDPTPALVDARLREQAAAMGADAVINVTYGKVGMSLMSWGSLDGSGRAVKWR